LPGFVLAFHFVPHNEAPDEIGRVSLWADHAAVDHAATNSHVMALRSQVRMLLHEESDERLVEVKGTSGDIPAPRAAS
jgi:quinol monooxygenase YgiN